MNKLLLEARDDRTGAPVVFAVTVPEGLTKLDTFLLVLAHHDAGVPQPLPLNLDSSEMAQLAVSA